MPPLPSTKICLQILPSVASDDVTPLFSHNAISLVRLLLLSQRIERVPNVKTVTTASPICNCHYSITHLSDEACLCPPYTQLRRCPLPDPLPTLPQGWSDTHLSHTQYTPHLSHIQYTPVSHTYNIPACIHLIQNYTAVSRSHHLHSNEASSGRQE